MTRSIPILMYHHVSPDREITPEGLERQLNFLLDQGYRSLSLDELRNILDGKGTEGQPGFVVTIDDGYLDNWLYAFPVFQKLGVKAAIYVITDRIEEHPSPRTISGTLNTRIQERGPGGFLSWAELRVMAASGLITIGSHTRTHRDFVRNNKYTDIASELRESKARIEKEIGRPCTHVAWPWGDYENGWKDLSRALGYTTAATTRGGANRAGTDAFELRRFKVSRESLAWLKKYLFWTTHPILSGLFGLTYGVDRRFKRWLKKESPYPHG